MTGKKTIDFQIPSESVHDITDVLW